MLPTKNKKEPEKQEYHRVLTEVSRDSEAKALLYDIFLNRGSTTHPKMYFLKERVVIR